MPYMLNTFWAWLAFFACLHTSLAQVYTTTLPWDSGNTIVVSQSTNANGATVAITTLSTITATATTTGKVTTTTTAVDPDDTTTSIPLVATTTKKTTTKTTTTSSTASTVVVSTTSWYWYTSDGVEYSTYFTPSFTTALSATPASSGSVMAYSDYLSSVDAALATAGTNSALVSGAIQYNVPWKALAGVIVGVIGGAALFL